MLRAHQPDQAVFRSILPEDIDWNPFRPFRRQCVLPFPSVIHPSPALMSSG